MELIKGLEYDDGVKQRFERQVSSKLYKSHTSFLSSPLLTTIMLLTFEDFAEVPDKMHSFYSQAFDTLFQKHDVHKEQFQRKTHTGLTREDFKATFAAFSAFSYIEERFSFEDDALSKTASRAIAYMRQANETIKPSVTGSQLIADLRESVCMIHKDGLETAYVHRSFQEYFAALFVTSIHGEMVKQFMNLYARRWADSVIVMARDMSRETVEQEWVLPSIKRLLDLLFPDGGNFRCFDIMANLLPGILLHKVGDKIYFSSFSIKEENLGPLESIARLYTTHLTPGSLLQPLSDLNLRKGRKLWCSASVQHLPGSKTFADVLKKNVSSNRGIAQITISEDDEWWLQRTDYPTYFEQLRVSLEAIAQDVSIRARKRTDILETLFPSAPIKKKRRRSRSKAEEKASAESA